MTDHIDDDPAVDTPVEPVEPALAWGSVPIVVALVLWIPSLALFGEEMFTSYMPRLESSLASPSSSWPTALPRSCSACGRSS